MHKRYLLIGIDGGATKVNGWSINVSENKFTLERYNSVAEYADQDNYINDFRPINLEKQLAELENGKIQISDSERKQAQAFIQATFEIIKDIVQQSGINQVLIGEGMPGLKTEDQRGIAVMANGPRIVNYCDELERRLEAAGIELIQPIAKLGSDAYYCGLGEEFAKNGKFANVKNSYYLGGGTGTADALKLEGELINLDDIKDWFVKTWELKNERGFSQQRYASAQGIQEIYAENTGRKLGELNRQKIYPIQIWKKACANDKAAIKTFDILTKNLARLVYERISTLYSGWQDCFSFVSSNRIKPRSDHPYKGTLLDSIIIGQRLGEVFKRAEDENILWEPFLKKLSILINTSSCLDETAKSHYCPNGEFHKDIIENSELREAPALGAGIDAYFNHKSETKPEEKDARARGNSRN
ncbi:MAG: hypothetical protein K9M80_09485 [Candidatus Marinimicrobia bacterium]|nr:hypothetical protein [Candidatus Neomarinimicrobiota bacterium]